MAHLLLRGELNAADYSMQFARAPQLLEVDDSSTQGLALRSSARPFVMSLATFAMSCALTSCFFRKNTSTTSS